METIYLDPTSSGIANRYEWEITTYIGPDDPDWGDAQIESYLADQQIGSVPVDFRVPNRTVTIPLGALQDLPSRDFYEARDWLQQKTGLFQREGGVLGRDTPVGIVYADIIGASLKLGGSALQAHGHVDPDASLTLECLPDWYEDEVAHAVHNETTLPDLVFTETGIRGNFPLGNRCRLVLTDLQGEDQLGAIWGFRSRNYSDDALARLGYEAESMTAVSPAASTSQAGASGGNVMQHAALDATWQDVLVTSVAGHVHTGTYRVWARVRSTTGEVVSVRFLWGVGGEVGTTNPQWSFPGASAFYPADLGEIRLDAPPVGPHMWQGTIQATSSSGSGQVQIDRLYLQPLDEAAGGIAQGGNADEAAIFASQSTEIRSDGVFRETLAAAGNYGRAHFVTGDLPRLPQAGLEDRTLEVFVLTTRSDLDDGTGMPSIADSAIDDKRAQLYERPCWLYVPDETGS